MTRADAPRVLEYNWGGYDMRWELEAVGGGTRLTLWHNIDRRYISMGAAGWHICLDVLDHLLGGDPIGRIVGRRRDEVRRLAAAERGVREAVRRSKRPAGRRRAANHPSEVHDVMKKSATTRANPRRG